MHNFVKLFTLLIYVCLTLFANNGEILACVDIEQSVPQQYYISQLGNRAEITNKKEEYYIISQSRGRSEITNPTNRSSNYVSGHFGNCGYFDISDSFLDEYIAYSVRISHNISPNLKNAIYTRAP